MTTLLRMTDLAKHFGVERATVSAWKYRHDDFPQPSSKSVGVDVYDLEEVIAFTHRHNLPDDTKKGAKAAARRYELVKNGKVIHGGRPRTEIRMALIEELLMQNTKRGRDLALAVLESPQDRRFDLGGTAYEIRLATNRSTIVA